MFYCSPSEYAFNSVRSFKTIVVQNRTDHSFYTKNYTIYYFLTTNCMLNGSCSLFFFFLLFCCCFSAQFFASKWPFGKRRLHEISHYFNTSIILVTKWALAWNVLSEYLCTGFETFNEHVLNVKKNENAKVLNRDKNSKIELNINQRENHLIFTLTLS